jgi:hypothetical protein
MTSTKTEVVIVRPRRIDVFIKKAILNSRVAVPVLMDLGSKYTFIKESTAKFYNLNIKNEETDFIGTWHKYRLPGQLTKTVIASITIDGVSPGNIKILVVPDNVMKYQMLIGRDWLGQPAIDFRKTRKRFIVSSRDHSFVDIIVTPIPPWVKKATINRKHKIRMTIDSSSYYTLIKYKLVKKWNLKRYIVNKELYGIGKCNVLIKERAEAVVEIDGIPITTDIYLAENLIPDGIIGKMWLNHSLVRFRKTNNNIKFLKKKSSIR